ncbi:MAG: hypothetical protein Q8S05_09205, partial [Sulfuricella sp.]|nr:hypothetical protein [Sulfuricella sp.]
HLAHVHASPVAIHGCLTAKPTKSLTHGPAQVGILADFDRLLTLHLHNKKESSGNIHYCFKLKNITTKKGQKKEWEGCP